MAAPAKTCQVVSQADSQQINPVSTLSLNPFVVGSLMIPHRETTTETTITGFITACLSASPNAAQVVISSH